MLAGHTWFTNLGEPTVYMSRRKKRTSVGYYQFTLGLEALGMSLCSGRIVCTDIHTGGGKGGVRESGKGGEKLVVVEPAQLRILLE